RCESHQLDPKQWPGFQIKWFTRRRLGDSVRRTLAFRLTKLREFLLNHRHARCGHQLPDWLAIAFQERRPQTLMASHQFGRGPFQRIEIERAPYFKSKADVVDGLAAFQLLEEPHPLLREERRVGKESRSRWSPYH